LSNLISSTIYAGGLGNDIGYDVFVDNDGYVYLTGQTGSPDLPIVNGFDTSLNGFTDAFIAKFSPDLTTLIGSSFLGGDYEDACNSIIVDNSGIVYVAGWGEFGIPLSKMVIASKIGNNIDTSYINVYFGGTSNDVGKSVFLDNQGYVYIGGVTHSSNFPIVNGFDTIFGNLGTTEGFVSKLKNDLTQIVASTFIGGGEDEAVNSLFIDNNFNVYITGWTSSSDFPLLNPYDSTFNGGSDIFVSKLDRTLSSLQFSTYIGGSAGDVGLSIYVTSSDDIYVSGNTHSLDFPVVNGYDSTFNGDTTNIFVLKLTPASHISENTKGVYREYHPIFIKDNKIIFNISVPSYIGINIYSENGALVKKISYGYFDKGKYAFLLPVLKKGVYFLKVRMGERVYTHKWVVVNKE